GKGHTMFASLGLLLAVLSVGTCAPLQNRGTRSKLLLVSFDGFRWNYDQDVDTPNLDTMAREGVKAQYMTPAFITITSPCHFTLVTGELPPTPRQGREQAGVRGQGGA
uniref:Ectonucleotide pyrophosphatase/phosphodiesterase 7 n=1 Tax=Pelusios castaneus TaxID=367368 RepID=A0A8C8S4D0_9SAUR